MIRIGTAGWSLPADWKDRFPEGEGHLQRYAGVFRAVEIDRTFYKTPRASTFRRWSESVPGAFRFALKVPKAVTHERRLEETREPLGEFLEAARELGDRLGPLLVQLPPSLEFDRGLARDFLEVMRGLHDGEAVLEARHRSWFATDAEDLLGRHRVARVAADPPRAEGDGLPGAHRSLAYFRLHGQPELYRSAYRDGDLERWADRIRTAARKAEEVWCIFDNTAAGAATGDALALLDLLGEG